MRKFLAVSAVVLSLAGLSACNTPGERAVAGAAIGGLTGAAIGGLATGRAGGAVVGGVVGAAGGAIIGASTAPVRERCYYSRYYRRTICEQY
jgi:uncharacterized protein YcfJ